MPWALDVAHWTFDVFSLNSELIQILRRKISDDGPQPFAWFMAEVLYHSEHGYYASDRAAIGRRGDYFTNVSVGPLFGQLLAIQFAEIWERLEKPGKFTIVEQGAHHGEFARDVLGYVRQRFPDFFSVLRYQIVEPFQKLQDRQQQTLKSFDAAVEWRRSLDELEPFAGVHFSNELLDSMPINLPNKLVGLSGHQFRFVEAGIEQMLNRSQLNWIGDVAAKLQRGFVVVVDYGFCGDDFRELVQVRTNHRLLDSPFEQIGDADIAAHVNWTDIAAAAEKTGLSIAGFADQHHFLTGVISAFPETVAGDKSKPALQTLLHPEMLGRSFQVLALSRDVDAISLSGFRFARDARKELGL